VPTVLERFIRFCVSALVVTGAGFALYTGATGPFEAPVQTGFFVMVTLPLVFLLAPSKLIKNDTAEAIFNIILAVLSVAVMAYNLVNFQRLYSEPSSARWTFVSVCWGWYWFWNPCAVQSVWRSP
jgi:TRAP-type uncharacterized transport system fused permease subunit